MTEGGVGVWEKMTDDNDRGVATSDPQDPHLLRWTFPPCQNLYGLTIQILAWGGPVPPHRGGHMGGGDKGPMGGIGA